MNPKADPALEQLAQAVKLPLGVVRGVLGDLANQKESRQTQRQIAARWGLGYGEISRMRNLGRVAIEDIREQAVTERLIIAKLANDHLMDRLNNAEQTARISARDLSQISKQQTDAALNMNNGRVG